MLARQRMSAWHAKRRQNASRPEATLCSATAPARLSRQEIRTVVEYFADLAGVVRDSDPTDKAGIAHRR
jgi:hypothetical protein